MKSLLTRNWKAKLISLIIACVIWYVIKNNVDSGPQRRNAFERKTESKI